MPGLVLKLRPGERIMVNGAVLENADRRSKLTVLTPNSQILRLKDAIHPDSAKTPVRRVCYILQLMIAGEADPAPATVQVERGIAQLRQAFAVAEADTALDEAQACLKDGQLYPALRALKSLLPLEDRLLGFAVEPPARTGSG
ncbi:MAG: flagellar biosynthesis repressor FlbT [Pseudomonadota bacterium]